MKLKCECGIYKNGMPQKPDCSVEAKTLPEAIGKVAEKYGISECDWQAIPSKLAISSNQNLHDIIEIKAKSEMSGKVYLKLPYEMTETQIIELTTPI